MKAAYACLKDCAPFLIPICNWVNEDIMVPIMNGGKPDWKTLPETERVAELVDLLSTAQQHQKTLRQNQRTLQQNPNKVISLPTTPI
jgi:hypothetical protein